MSDPASRRKATRRDPVALTSLPRDFRRRVRAQRARPVMHAFAPLGAPLEIGRARRRESVQQFVDRTGFDTTRLPTVLRVDGACYARKDWAKIRCDRHDEIMFLSLPRTGGSGGGAKQVLGVVAALALLVAAPWAAGALGPAIGGYFATAAGINTLSSIIMVGGALAISLFTRQKQKPKEEEKPLAALALGGNEARLGEPLPLLCGRMRWAPDKIASYTDYGNMNGSATPGFAGSSTSTSQQRTFQLLGVTTGACTDARLEFDDTLVWTQSGGLEPSFAGSLEVEMYPPGAPVTLFPINWRQSPEVTGQELFFDPSDPINPPPNNWVGGANGFVANDPGTTIREVSIDIGFPQGLIFRSGSGKIKTADAQVEFQYRWLNNAGAPVGAWQGLFSKTYVGASEQPVFYTEEVALGAPPAGGTRVAVRGRTVAKPNNSTVWQGMRAFLDGPNTFDVTTIAIKSTAGRQFANFQPANKYVTATSVRPVWNGTSWTNQPTRSPVWIAYERCVSQYGGGWSPSKFMLADLKALDDALAAGGYTFDHVFKQRTDCADGLTTILTAARSFWRQRLDRLEFVQDKARTVPAYFLTDQEIIKGSWQATYRMPTRERADGVTIRYLDEAAGFRPATVTWPTGAQNPVVEERIGVTNRTIANRHAVYQARHNALVASQSYSFQTEHDATLYGRGEMLAVSSHMFGEDLVKGQGRVVGRAGNVLTLNAPVKWNPSGGHAIEIRSRAGRWFGPISCSRGANDNEVVLSSGSLAVVEAAVAAQRSADGEGGIEDTLDEVLARADGAEEPSVAVSVAGTKRFLITGVDPSEGRSRVQISPYDSTIYTDSDGASPPPPRPEVPGIPLAIPVVLNLRAYYAPSLVGSNLHAGWSPHPSAATYRVRLSYDAGSTFVATYDVPEPAISIAVSYPAAVMIYVCGVMASGAEGPRASTSISEGDATVAPTPGTVLLEKLAADAYAQLDPEWLGWRSLQALATEAIQQEQFNQKLTAEANGNRATVEQNIQTLVTTDESLAQRTTLVEAQTAAAKASIADEAIARASADAAEASIRQAADAALESSKASASVVTTTIARVDTLDGTANALAGQSVRMSASGGDDSKNVAMEFQAVANSGAGVFGGYKWLIKMKDGVSGFVKEAGMRIEMGGASVASAISRILFSVDTLWAENPADPSKRTQLMRIDAGGFPRINYNAIEPGQMSQTGNVTWPDSIVGAGSNIPDPGPNAWGVLSSGGTAYRTTAVTPVDDGTGANRAVKGTAFLSGTIAVGAGASTNIKLRVRRYRVSDGALAAASIEATVTVAKNAFGSTQAISWNGSVQISDSVPYSPGGYQYQLEFLSTNTNWPSGTPIGAGEMSVALYNR